MNKQPENIELSQLCAEHEPERLEWTDGYIDPAPGGPNVHGIASFTRCGKAKIYLLNEISPNEPTPKKDRTLRELMIAALPNQGWIEFKAHPGVRFKIDLHGGMSEAKRLVSVYIPK